MRKRLLALTLVAGCLPALAWTQVPLGPAFRVNSYTTAGQYAHPVGVDATGAFVVVWTSLGPEPDLGVFARLHDASGTPLGSDEFRVTSHTPGHQHAPRVARSSDGPFVVVWQSPHDGSDFGVFARRFDTSGLPGAETLVNAYTTGGQSRPAVAIDAAGNFVVVWHSYQPSDLDVFGRRFDSSGAPRGPAFAVNSYTTGSQYSPAVATSADGGFVVAWTDAPSGSGDIRAQRYDAAGLPIGGAFRVNSYTTDLQIEAAVASAPDGRFVVVWRSIEQDGDSDGVFGQRYAPDGTPRGAEFRVNVTTTGSQRSGSVAMDPRGNFVVVWESEGADRAVYGRRFDDAGRPEGPGFRLHSVSAVQGAPHVAMAPSGDFVTAWSQLNGFDADVFARRFRPDVIFKDDFESAGLGAWSAASTDGGDLGPSVLAAMKATTIGLRGVVDDTAALFVQDDSPSGERLYSARFYLDPTGFDPGEAQQRFRTRVFIAFSEAPTRRVAAIVLRRLGGVYSIRARARLDDNTQEDTPFVPIDDGPHAIELFLLASSGPESNGGRLFLFIDGDLAAGHLGLDNSLAAVDFVRMGALSVKPGASGTLHWDEFESRRQSSPIGP